QESPHWQLAIETLINTAEGRDFTMHARIAVRTVEPRQARSCYHAAPETNQSLQNCTITRSALFAPEAKAEAVRDRAEVRL
ncbi:MAG TPA: hypothetical protein VK577_28765, partial [Bradyrhizobium sp.]|nr:hypothetical protein [Bradyrhizobium sp.]